MTCAPSPVSDGRKDLAGSGDWWPWGPDHYPEPCTKRRCVMCSMMKLQRRSMHQCKQCKAVLCINKERNCFSQYHTMYGFKAQK